MRFLLFSILFAGIFLAPGFALECFTCYDCPNPLNREAVETVTCTLDNVFPETPATTTTKEPTEPTTEPTTESTTKEPPTEPTTVPTTKEPTTEPTTVPTVPTDPTNPPPPTTESTTVTIPTEPSPPTTTDGPPLTMGSSPPPVVIPGGGGRRRRRRQANPEFRCFETTNEYNGTFRGCTRMLANEEDTCAAIGGEGCRVCNENGCNSATNLAVSVISVLIAVFVALRVY